MRRSRGLDLSSPRVRIGVSGKPMGYVDQLGWADAPDLDGRAILADLAAVDAEALGAFVIAPATAELPFFRHWRLLRLRTRVRTGGRLSRAEDVYALWRAGRRPMLLDGSSAPVHDANDDEGLALGPATTADYVRFFFFAIRGDTGAFTLFEEPPSVVPAAQVDAAQRAKVLQPAGTDPHGNQLFDAVVAYAGALFAARLAVQADGQVTMTDDDLLQADVPMSLVGQPPRLGLGSRVLAGVASAGRVAPTASTSAARHRAGSAPAAGTVAAAGAGPSSRPTIVELVELLLERALRDRTGNRLLDYFNATLPTADHVQRFAALVASSSPVVVVESPIPFVEETISEIINGRTPPSAQLQVCRGSIGVDSNGNEVLESFSLPSGPPAVVLVPLQVYRRVMQVERLAFDIAARDLGAIIVCARFVDLPESLRRHTDVLLRLPNLDDRTFKTLFERVMGAPIPAAWNAKGVDWVKHVLHTDFEHPRRMRLPPDAALDFVHAQVTERLGTVDPVQGMSLAQLHGLGEARQFAEDLIADIHAAIAGQLPWTQVDRGALLVGAPGTGKTTLARAIAKDCGVRFIQASASTWMAEGGSLGPHIAAIRRTFDEARSYAPSILFIDEIDSLGSREQFAGDNNSVYQTEVVNAVLEQMQGLDPRAPVFVLGATNHEDRVDPALKRSGRLDRVIHIPRPNSEALDHIYRYHLGQTGSGVSLGPDVDTLLLGRFSVGLTGADVERIVRGAARRARREKRALAQADLIDEITQKPRTGSANARMTAAELERTATHEAGHALAMFLSSTGGADIGYVTIVPRDDGTLGFVASLPDERLHVTRRNYEDQLDVWLAGRAAEELVYGADEVTSGAATDLQNATELVTRMVTQLGLGRGRGLLWSATLSAVDLELADRTLTESYTRVLGKLRAERTKLKKLARVLARRQELPGADVRAILTGRPRAR